MSSAVLIVSCDGRPDRMYVAVDVLLAFFEDDGRTLTAGEVREAVDALAFASRTTGGSDA